MASIKEAVAAEAKDPPKPEVPAPKTEAPKPAPQGETRFRLAAGAPDRSAEGIDIAALTGSGPRGRIVKADVEGAKAQPAAPKSRRRKRRKRCDNVRCRAAARCARLFTKKTTDEIPQIDAQGDCRRLTSSKTLIPAFLLDRRLA